MTDAFDDYFRHVHATERTKKAWAILRRLGYEPVEHPSRIGVTWKRAKHFVPLMLPNYE